jgi:cyclic pyranopterin phosphate synthase
VLYTCLGQDHHADLHRAMRECVDNEDLNKVILNALAAKPKGHDFVIDRRGAAPAVTRFMSTTGG